jgi:hypothetical protein
MFTIARKLCQVISQSARLRMSGTTPLLTPYALMEWTEKSLLFNTLKEICQFLVMLVYVIVLKHRRKTKFAHIYKKSQFSVTLC